MEELVFFRPPKDAEREIWKKVFPTMPNTEVAAVLCDVSPGEPIPPRLDSPLFMRMRFEAVGLVRLGKGEHTWIPLRFLRDREGRPILSRTDLISPHQVRWPLEKALVSALEMLGYPFQGGGL